MNPRPHWTEVPLFLVHLEEPIASGADVPARVVTMERSRRDAAIAGVARCTPAEHARGGAAPLALDPRGDATEWLGLDAAVARLSAADVMARAVGRVFAAKA